MKLDKPDLMKSSEIATVLVDSTEYRAGVVEL